MSGIAHWRCINDSTMDTKKYQSLFEGGENESQWVRSTEYPGTMEQRVQTNNDVLMDIVNAGRNSGSEMAFKESSGEKRVQPTACSNQSQPFAFPGFRNSVSGAKLEMDSKELSKTVAESMGLYMNDTREAEYGLGPQNALGGRCSPGKACQPGGQRPEDNVSLSTGSPNLKPSPSAYISVSRPLHAPPLDSTSGALRGTSAIAPVLHVSSPGSSSSSPGGNNVVSSTSSPTFFRTTGPSLSSPVSQNAVPSLGNVHPRNASTCSPAGTSVMGSPQTSPLDVMRSPISSPQSMGSVRSPPSCSANVRSSVSSPAGGASNISNGNVRASIYSPGPGGTVAQSSPRKLAGFPISSPAGGLGLVQSDIHSPQERDQDLKGFEFPKVECCDGEQYSVGLDQMGMVKYIKNEPDADFRSMCLGNDKGRMTNLTFPTQVKSEPSKDGPCMNPSYNEQESLNMFHASETTYLSLRDSMDEYSLSGILGPPVSSVSSNFEPGLFSNSMFPKGIKQEYNATYYQESNNSQTPAIVGVNSGGHSFHYQIGAQGTMSFSRHDVRDQSNPLLNLISPVTALMETWKARRGLPQTPLSSRGEGYPGQSCLAENMSR
ncbi:mineralocorticoid receptor-like [Arapaima gigas]